jgi:hypothetical protein
MDNIKMHLLEIGVGVVWIELVWFRIGTGAEFL